MWRCHGGSETCTSLTGVSRWRVRTGKDSNYESAYLFEVHTFPIYCRLGPSWNRTVPLKKRKMNWADLITFDEINIESRKKIQYILSATWDSYCFTPSLLRTEGGGAKPEHKQDGHRRWEVRQSCSSLSFYWFCKEGNYLSFVRSRGSDCPHGCAPSTCVRKPLHGLWRSLRKFVFEQSRLPTIWITVVGWQDVPNVTVTSKVS